MAKNLHKLYYKDYYKDVAFTVVEEQDRNGRVTTSVKATNPVSNRDLLSAQNAPIAAIGTVNKCMELETLYPGLITGVGLNHEAGVDGEFKLGMHFDYTRGMPVIYGSSVKGVLKSYFSHFAGEFENFEDDIFEGVEKEGFKSIYDRDIFFDAVITKPNKQGKILDSDTLCPHGDNPLKNPTPISFLKIASGVTIEFRFKLVESKIGETTMTQKNKEDIFKEILTTVGIGAKTNVGYGQFKSTKEAAQ